MTSLIYKDLSKKFKGERVLSFDTQTSKEFNQRLSNLAIHQSETLVKGLKGHSWPKNFSGWGRTNVFDWANSEAMALNKIVTECFNFYKNRALLFGSKSPKQYIMCWQNVSFNFDGKEPPHVHHMSALTFTGVYYAAGNFNGSKGNTVFWIDKNNTQFKIVHKPYVGNLIIFPGCLSHATSKYADKVARVSFAFDIRLKEVTFPPFLWKKEMMQAKYIEFGK